VDLETPEEGHQAYCEIVARKAQCGNWTKLLIPTFRLDENLQNNISTVYYSALLEGESPLSIVGSGQGVVDALFGSLVESLSPRFLSLNQLEFEDFALRVSFAEARHRARTDAPVEVCLTISSSPFYKTFFRHESVSLVSASIEVVRKSVEYFINLEKAFFLLRGDIVSATERDRQDLIIEASSNIVEIVKIISFEELLAPQRSID
jgi:hypothetical protein